VRSIAAQAIVLVICDRFTNAGREHEQRFFSTLQKRIFVT